MQEKNFKIEYICLRHVDEEYKFLFGIHEVYWMDGVPEEICQIPVLYDDSITALRERLQKMLDVTYLDIPIHNT
jgi:hypothetical protein